MDFGWREVEARDCRGYTGPGFWAGGRGPRRDSRTKNYYHENFIFFKIKTSFRLSELLMTSSSIRFVKLHIRIVKHIRLVLIFEKKIGATSSFHRMEGHPLHLDSIHPLTHSPPTYLAHIAINTSYELPIFFQRNLKAKQQQPICLSHKYIHPTPPSIPKLTSHSPARNRPPGLRKIHLLQRHAPIHVSHRPPMLHRKPRPSKRPHFLPMRPRYKRSSKT